MKETFHEEHLEKAKHVASKEDKEQGEEAPNKPRNWLRCSIIAGLILVIVLIIAIAVPLALKNKDDDDDNDNVTVSETISFTTTTSDGSFVLAPEDGYEASYAEDGATVVFRGNILLMRQGQEEEVKLLGTPAQSRLWNVEAQLVVDPSSGALVVQQMSFAAWQEFPVLGQPLYVGAAPSATQGPGADIFDDSSRRRRRFLRPSRTGNNPARHRQLFDLPDNLVDSAFYMWIQTLEEIRQQDDAFATYVNAVSIPDETEFLFMALQDVQGVTDALGYDYGSDSAEWSLFQLVFGSVDPLTTKVAISMEQEEHPATLVSMSDEYFGRAVGGQDSMMTTTTVHVNVDKAIIGWFFSSDEDDDDDDDDSVVTFQRRHSWGNEFGVLESGVTCNSFLGGDLELSLDLPLGNATTTTNANITILFEGRVFAWHDPTVLSEILGNSGDDDLNVTSINANDTKAVADALALLAVDMDSMEFQANLPWLDEASCALSNVFFQYKDFGNVNDEDTASYGNSLAIAAPNVSLSNCDLQFLDQLFDFENATQSVDFYLHILEQRGSNDSLSEIFLYIDGETTLKDYANVSVTSLDIRSTIDSLEEEASAAYYTISAYFDLGRFSFNMSQAEVQVSNSSFAYSTEWSAELDDFELSGSVTLLLEEEQGVTISFDFEFCANGSGGGPGIVIQESDRCYNVAQEIVLETSEEGAFSLCFDNPLPAQLRNLLGGTLSEDRICVES